MSLQIISIILGSLTIASALMVVLSKHPIRSVIFLVVTFFFISSLYVLMNAQFLAIVNIIVYAGLALVFLPFIFISFFALESLMISMIGLLVYILFVGCIALPDKYWEKILCCNKNNITNTNEIQLDFWKKERNSSNILMK